MNMGHTVKELFGKALSFSVVLALFNLVAMIAIYSANETTAGWCTQSNSAVQFKLSGFTGPLVFLSFASSFWALTCASDGLMQSSYKALRKCQYLAFVTIFMALWMLLGLYYDIGVLNGRMEELLSNNENSYCQGSTPWAVDAVVVGWILLLISQSALSVLANNFIRTLDPLADDISLFNLGIQAIQTAAVFYRRGRKGVLKSVVFAKKYIQRSIRVKTQHDDVFREVSFTTGMMRCTTLQELKDAIGDRFDMPANDIRSLLKNGNVVIENDDDVARLRSSDYIDVVFGNARPFEQVPDLIPAFVPVVPRPYEPVPVYAPFNASLSQIV